MHIVLHEPEIPGNTGNIGRSCAATNTSLHLIEPLGFDITEKELRRAGLDYWSQLDVHRYRDYEDFLLEQFGSRSYRSGRSDGGNSLTNTGDSGSSLANTDDGGSSLANIGDSGSSLANTGDGGNSSANTGDNRSGLTNPDDSKSRLTEDSERRPPRIWFATTKARKLYSEADFGPDDYIMFGKESAGIPEEILVDNEETCIRIPMGYGIRSLNLSNAVAVVLYEALRRNGFPGLEREGELHRLHWKD